MPTDYVWVGGTWINIHEISDDGAQPKVWYSSRAAQEFASKQKLDANESVAVMKFEQLKAKSR